MEERRVVRRPARLSFLLFICAATVLIPMSSSAAGDWTPPSDPNPDRILSEAQDDTGAGRYADALAKHVWFHENALKYEPAMYGVRLSFALSYWRNLANLYPPALTKLKAVRDEAGNRVRGGVDSREAFIDFAAINRELKEEGQTRDLFRWLDSTSPEMARQVFDSAEPALIQAKEYQLCGKYLDPDRSFRRIVDLYRETMRMARDPASELGEYSKDLEEHSARSFANDAATLVAVLVLNDRQADAERIAAEALKESDGPALKEALPKALKGELPPRWP